MREKPVVRVASLIWLIVDNLWTRYREWRDPVEEGEYWARARRHWWRPTVF